MRVGNIKTMKVCAFCEHWYDPTFQYVKPRAPLGGFWEFDDKVRCMCTVTGLPKPGYASCSKFRLRIK